MASKPVILIEDDEDDVEIFMLAYAEAGYPNELKVFRDPEAAWDFLRGDKTEPLMVISDINMPKISGFELRDRIMRESSLGKKCFPYIFLSTSTDQNVIETGFSKSIQGFFYKEPDFVQFTEMVRNIMFYWTSSKRPLIDTRNL